VVRTELGEREYDLLSEVAKKKGLTIKEDCPSGTPRLEYVEDGFEE